MNFDRFTQNYQELKSPVSDFLAQGGPANNYSDFLSLLRREDLKLKKVLKRFYIIYIVVVFIYFMIFIVNPDPGLEIRSRISGGSYVLAFLIFIWLLRGKYLKMKKVDYTAPPKYFLNEAKTRFSLWNKQMLWLIPFLLLIDLGATLSMTNYIESNNILTEILLIQIGYIFLIAVSFYFGILDWRKKKKPIYKKIQTVLSEFED